MSTEDQAERGSIETQVEFARRWAPAHGYEIVGEYLDPGVSGTIPVAMRPAGARLLADARAGLFAVVLVYQVDRLGRDPQVVLTALTDLQACGVRIQSMNEAFDERDPMGRFLLTLLSSIGRLVRDQTIIRSMEGSARLAREGAWLGGVAPYGYRVEGHGRAARLVVYEPEAETVRLVYALYLEDGWSAVRIAQHLNARGIPLRSGRGVWTHGQVIRMLSATDYKGVHQYGKRSRRDRTLIEHPVPALVSEEMWDQVRARAAERLQRARRNTKYDYLLRDLLRCGLPHCGRRIYGGVLRRPSGEYTYYRCSSYSHPIYGSAVRRGCGLTTLPRAEGEARAWERVVRLIDDPHGLETVLREVPAVTATDTQRAELAQVRELLKEREAGRRRLLGLVAKGLASEEEVGATLAELRAEDATLKQLEVTLAATCREHTVSAAVREEIREAVDRLRAELREGVTWDRQRRTLVRLVREFVVTPHAADPKELVLSPRWTFVD